MLLDDTARRTGRLRDKGQVHLIECEDEALAALVVSDRHLRALCTRLGERHLVVSPEQLQAFRKATRALGHTSMRDSLVTAGVVRRASEMGRMLEMNETKTETRA
jgi:hypothetical protein